MVIGLFRNSESYKESQPRNGGKEGRGSVILKQVIQTPFLFLTVFICSSRKYSCVFYDGWCQVVICSWFSISGVMCYFCLRLSPPHPFNYPCDTVLLLYDKALSGLCTLELFWKFFLFESLLSSLSFWKIDKAILISMNDDFSLCYTSDIARLCMAHAHIIFS